VISDLNNAQSSLVQSVKETQQANQAKSDFLANMSHELRTPINSILGMTQLLDKKLVQPENKKMFDIVKTSSVSLLNIVNDILDLAKIEAKEVQLEHIGFDVFERLRHVVQSVMPQINKKGLSINYDADAKQMQVLGDPLRFERIVTNLVSNAIRYTNEGGITIKLETLEGKASVPTILRCEVIDTGVGIPKDRQSKIFGKFVQADTSDTRLYGGTGLGLTISKKLVELMHGKIGFNSEVGKGSKFWFEIPFETTEELDLSPASTSNNTAPNAITISAIPVETVKILVAEDHEMNQFFVKKMFKDLGIKQYKIVENGQEAVEEIQKGQYDLLLMDCHMPKVNGYVATETIRNLDNIQKRNLPIVAMTANAMIEDKARCLDVGMNDYVCKPVEIETFKRVLSQWIKF
jgi:CheY-like chemotaxis protein